MIAVVGGAGLRGGTLITGGAGPLHGAAEGELGGVHLPPPDKGDGGGITGLVALAAHSGGQILLGGDGGGADHGDDIPRLEARLGGGAILHHLRQIGPAAHAGLRVVGGAGRADAHVGVGCDLAVFHDILEHVEHIVNGDGEAQALGGGAVAGGGVLGGDDAHHLSVGVEEGPAGVAAVDGGSDLDHVEGGAVYVDLPVEAGDNALAHGEGELAQGVADGGHVLAHPQVGALADDHGGQLPVPGVDFDNGDVVVLVAAHDLGGVGLAVAEADLHVIAAADHMVVGDDVAVLGDDEAAAGAGGLDLTPKVVIALGDGDDIDAHAAAHVGVVDLRQGQLLGAGDGHGGDLRSLPVAEEDGGLGAVLHAVPAAPRIAQEPSRAKGAAQQERSAQDAGRHPLPDAVSLGLNGLQGGNRLTVIGMVAVVVLVVVSILLVIHLESLLEELVSRFRVVFFRWSYYTGDLCPKYEDFLQGF